MPEVGLPLVAGTGSFGHVLVDNSPAPRSIPSLNLGVDYVAETAANFTTVL